MSVCSSVVVARQEWFLQDKCSSDWLARPKWFFQDECLFISLTFQAKTILLAIRTLSIPPPSPLLTHMRTCMRTCIYTRMHAHTHTHARLHTYSPPPPPPLLDHAKTKAKKYTFGTLKMHLSSGYTGKHFPNSLWLVLYLPENTNRCTQVKGRQLQRWTPFLKFVQKGYKGDEGSSAEMNVFFLVCSKVIQGRGRERYWLEWDTFTCILLFVPGDNQWYTHQLNICLYFFVCSRWQPASVGSPSDRDIWTPVIPSHAPSVFNKSSVHGDGTCYTNQRPVFVLTTPCGSQLAP